MLAYMNAVVFGNLPFMKCAVCQNTGSFAYYISAARRLRGLRHKHDIEITQICACIAGHNRITYA